MFCHPLALSADHRERQARWCKRCRKARTRHSFNTRANSVNYLKIRVSVFHPNATLLGSNASELLYSESCHHQKCLLTTLKQFAWGEKPAFVLLTQLCSEVRPGAIQLSCIHAQMKLGAKSQHAKGDPGSRQRCKSILGSPPHIRSAHQIYRYAWDNFLWKKAKPSWWRLDSFRLGGWEKAHMQTRRRGWDAISPPLPHTLPSLTPLAVWRLFKPRAVHWRAKGLNPTLGTPQLLRPAPEVQALKTSSFENQHDLYLSLEC